MNAIKSHCPNRISSENSIRNTSKPNQLIINRCTIVQAMRTASRFNVQTIQMNSKMTKTFKIRTAKRSPPILMGIAIDSVNVNRRRLQIITTRMPMPMRMRMCTAAEAPMQTEMKQFRRNRYHELVATIRCHHYHLSIAYRLRIMPSKNPPDGQLQNHAQPPQATRFTPLISIKHSTFFLTLFRFAHCTHARTQTQKNTHSLTRNVVLNFVIFIFVLFLSFFSFGVGFIVSAYTCHLFLSFVSFIGHFWHYFIEFKSIVLRPVYLFLSFFICSVECLSICLFYLLPPARCNLSILFICHLDRLLTEFLFIYFFFHQIIATFGSKTIQCWIGRCKL